MKKAVLIAVLVLLLLLTSCKVDVTDTRSPNVFHMDALPDIGTFSGMANRERFYDEITYDFVPNDEYGKIIPYIGSYRLFETPKVEGEDWHTEMGYCTYGFCTTDGKIVMDASDKNTYIMYHTTDDGFGFYTVTREARQKDDAPDEYLPTETYVIPLDGSWCLKFDGNSWVSNSGGGYIGVCDYPEDGSDVRTHLYDYDGNLVKTIEGVDSTGIYSHGLMLISEWTSDGYRAHFIDENEEIVLGPYSSASDFNEYGITAVTDVNGAYLVNTKGERLTGYYDSFYKEFSDDMKKQVFFGRHPHKKEGFVTDNEVMSDVYSEKGELLGTIKGLTYASFRFPNNEDIYYYYTNYDNIRGYAVGTMIWKRLGDDADLVSKDFGVMPNSYSGTDNCFIHLDKDQNKAILINGDGETVAVIDGANEVVNTSEYGEFVIYIEGEYNYGIDELTGLPFKDTRKTHIYDTKKGEIVYTVEASGNTHFADEKKRFLMITVYDEVSLFGGDVASWLFDTVSGKIVFESCKEISLYEIEGVTYINVCTENSSALYDENFNVIRKSYFE